MLYRELLEGTSWQNFLMLYNCKDYKNITRDKKFLSSRFFVCFPGFQSSSWNISFLSLGLESSISQNIRNFLKVFFFLIFRVCKVNFWNIRERKATKIHFWNIRQESSISGEKFLFSGQIFFLIFSRLGLKEHQVAAYYITNIAYNI